MKKYYLAYGSNLNREQMGYRCPTAQPVGTAQLICPDCGTREALEGLGLSREEQEHILGNIHRYQEEQE